MKNMNFCTEILAILLLVGMTFVGCELTGKDEEKFDPGTINGVWYLEDSSGNKTGSAITIEDNSGTLTAIGNDDFFSIYLNAGKLSIGDTILRNISFKGTWNDSTDSTNNPPYWTCESYIPFYIGYTYAPDLYWENSYIHYDKLNDYIFVYTMGDPSYGWGFRYYR